MPSLTDIDSGRSKGKEAGKNGGIDGRVRNDFQHHPAHCEHLGDGADFSNPMGRYVNFAAGGIENANAAEDDAIAA